jgi:hypothetical protein
MDGFNTPGFRISHPESLQNKTFEEGDPACVLKFSPAGSSLGAGGGPAAVAAPSTGAPASLSTPAPTAQQHAPLNQKLSQALTTLPNFHKGVGANNKTDAQDKSTWLAGLSSNAGTQEFYVESITGGAPLKAIPFSAHSTITTCKTVAQTIPNRSLDPRTFIDMSNFNLTAFGANTSEIEPRVFLVQALLEVKCFEHRGSESDPRGICGDTRSDGVRMGDKRYLNDGTEVYVLAVGLVSDSRTSPFTYMAFVWGVEEQKILFVPHNSVMKVINEEKVPTPSSALKAMSDSEMDVAVGALVGFVDNGTEKTNESVFFCCSTETLWKGNNNRIPFGPGTKKGRKSLVRKGEAALTLRSSTEPKQSKKAKKAAAAAAAGASTALSTSTSMVAFEPPCGRSKRGGNSGPRDSGWATKRIAPESRPGPAEEYHKVATTASLAISRAEASRDAAVAALKATQEAARVQALHANQLRAVEAQGHMERISQLEVSTAEVQAVLKDHIKAQASAAQQQMQHGSETNAQFLDFMLATSSTAGTSASGETDLQMLLKKVGLEGTFGALRKEGVTSVAVLKELVESDAESVGLTRFQLHALPKNID